MIKILGLVTIVMLVLGVGTFFLESGAPNVLAQQWKTFYSPEYKFAIDYPNDQTNITDRVTNNTLLDKLIKTQLNDFIIKVEKDTKDPQEVLVALSQKLSPDYKPMEGGVKPIMVDFVPGYMYNAIGLTNGGIMITVVNFEHNGYLYTFMIIPLNGFDRTDHHKFVSSIKFFD